MSVVVPPTALQEPALWFIFRKSELLIRQDGDLALLPRLVNPADIGLEVIRQQYLGVLGDRHELHCFSAEVAEDCSAPDNYTFKGLRRLYQKLEDDLFWLAGRAIQIVDWDRTHLYCGRCSAPTQNMAKERAKKCPQCGLTSYPRLSPAIIVSVERPGENGLEILLGRSHRHPQGLFSVLAGFVEPGETLEECVRREVREEVGIELKNIRYFGSQPWPFPNSLMLGFTAEYASGEIVLEEEELDEAYWFTADNLPKIPSAISISRKLIDAFVARAHT